jgi:glycerol-3-phosphate acyltransferase PlsY
MPPVNPWWLLVPLSYVLGSMPVAGVVAGTAGHDPTREGSGNPGASNVFRVAGVKAGVVVLLGDVLKGLAPTLMGLAVDGRPLGLAAGLAAMVGHIAPLGRLRRGGKGVATLGGTTLGLYPLGAAALIVVWLLVAAKAKVASVASLVVVGVLPVVVAASSRSWGEVAAVAAASAIVALRHRANIERLMAGQEHQLR